MEKVLHDVKELLEEEIKKITKKGDISANELANLEKAVCLADRVQDMLNDMEGYSEGESYGMHPRNRMMNPRMNYSDDAMYSGRRGRSPVTGRYISRGMEPMYGYHDDMYAHGYSGHSINDRMIAKLEEMYDTAKTEHEKEVVDKWIKRLETER